MASLLVRGLDDTLVKALKARAGEHGHSAEAVHRRILKEALEQPRRRSFGTRMIASLGKQLSGEVQLSYQPSGFLYVLERV